MLNNSHLITETIKPLLPTSLGQDSSNQTILGCFDFSTKPKTKVGKNNTGKKDVCHIDISILEGDVFVDDSQEKTKDNQPKQLVKKPKKGDK